MGAEFLGVAEESPSKIYISGCINDEKNIDFVISSV
jgi:hypothetical protein